MVQQISGTVAFFKAMALVLIANALTVTFVYSVAKINQLEQNGRGSGAAHLSPAAYPCAQSCQHPLAKK